MKLSVLTATYNRGKYLKRIYESIIKNEKHNLEIEWIIINDGSFDKTDEIVKNFDIKENYEIKYIYQTNKGKMEAINKAAEIATGDLIVDCDSDDYFEGNAFKIIEENSKELMVNEDLYGLCFFKKKTNGKISGRIFEQNREKTTMFDLYFKKKMDGEKILVFKSNIRKKYKHELEGDEKFITEARMYHKMDEKYKIMCINEIIEIGDYEKDGYTKNIRKIQNENPKGYYMYFKEILDRGIKGVSFGKKIHIIKNYLNFKIKK